MGGSRDASVHAQSNLLTLCRRCHRNLHEGGWSISLSETELRVTDARSGTEVMRRLYRQGFDASAFLSGFNEMESLLGEGIGSIAFLDDEQLVEAFRISRTVGKKAWLVQAAILYEAQRRSVYGEGRVVAIARQFEIGVRQAEKYALVWRTFFNRDEMPEALHGPSTNSVNVDAIFLEEPSWYVVAATESPEPHKWLAYAQDRKAENPRYSISDFRPIYNPCTRRALRPSSLLAMWTNGGAAGGSVHGSSRSARAMAGQFRSKSAGASEMAIRRSRWQGACHDERDGRLRGSIGAVRPREKARTIGEVCSRAIRRPL